MNSKAIVASLAAASFAVGTLCLAADVTAGNWKLNAAKSKYTPAAQAKYDTIKIDAAGDSMKVTLDGTDSAGKEVHAQWTGKYDAKEYPVTGSPDIDSLAYTKVNDHNYQSTTKKGGKTMGTSKIVYSADGKSRTVTSSGTDAKGQKVNATAVYDKQ